MPSILLLLAFPLQAQTRLVHWDFNKATFVDERGGDTGADFAYRATSLNGAGLSVAPPLSPGSGGKYANTYVNSGLNQVQPTFVKNNGNWNLSEFTVQFYMYIDPDIVTSGSACELESLKLFQTNSSSDLEDKSGFPYIVNMYFYPANTWHIYLTNASGTWFGTHNGGQVGTWHRYTIYTKFNTPGVSDGLVRIYVDGVLKGEALNVNFRSHGGQVVNSFGAVYHAKTFGSPVGQIEGHIRLDDLEFWEGNPIALAPFAPKNVHLQR